MEIAERVRQAVVDAFPGCDPRLEWDDGLQKVVGVVLWDDFEKLDHVTRQRKLWSVLKKALGPNAQQVSLLLTYTPHEYETYLAA